MNDLKQKVALYGMDYYALHGFYAEEQLTGGRFSIDVEVVFTPDADTENLNKTVNYEILNSIVTEEMAKTQKLLETVVRNILERITSSFPFVDGAKVGMRKLNPPMRGQIAQAYVELEYKR